MIGVVMLESPAPQPQQGWLHSRVLWWFVFKCVLVLALALALGLTYNSCIRCVIAVAVVSAVFMNCVPLMPLVFLVSLGVLVLHAIDYHNASIRVEVPLQDVVYVPTWDDVQKYVHVNKPAG
jgi:hypothetical protein